MIYVHQVNQNVILLHHLIGKCILLLMNALSRSAEEPGQVLEDFGALDNESLKVEITETRKALSQTQARLMKLLAELDRRQAYREDGASSIEEWSSMRLGMTQGHGRSLSGLAKSLERLPALERALATGKVSLDQVEPLARVATREMDEELAEAVEGWSVTQCRRHAKKIAMTKDVQNETKDSKGYLTLGQYLDGSWKIAGHLTAEQGNCLDRALGHLASKAGPDPETQEYEPWGVRMADALVELVGAGFQQHEPATPFVLVHMHAGVLAGMGSSLAAKALGEKGLAPNHGIDISLLGAEIEDFDGDAALVHAEVGRRLACDSRWQAVADDLRAEPFALGQVERSAPQFMRRALKKRDGLCRFPGCDRSRYLHAHHIIHWADGGPTELWNLVLLCNRHHKFLHEKRWRLEGDPREELIFVSPEGKRTSSRPAARVLPSGPAAKEPEDATNVSTG
jgi:hypothetical protein